MTRNVTALVVHENAGMREHLQGVLQAQRVPTLSADSCREVEAVLALGNAPMVIFTGANFSDGNWREVLKLARKAVAPADVVVALDDKGPYLDADEVKLYLDAMDAGAFDFMVRPFAPNDVACVLRRAVDDLAARGKVRRVARDAA